MKTHLNTPKILTVRPGFGADTIHIRQTEEEVKSVFGRPESRTRKFKGQYYYNYPSKGIELDFGKTGGRLKHIFFYREGVRGNRKADVVTDSGIRPGDSRQRVVEVLGEPDKQGEPVVLHSGIRFGEWYLYKSGITFQFGGDGRIDMITISRPSANRRERSAVD